MSRTAVFLMGQSNLSPFPSWAFRVEVCGKIFSLMQVPRVTQLHIQADDFYRLSSSQIYFPS